MSKLDELLSDATRFCEESEFVANEHGVYIYTSTNGANSLNLAAICNNYKDWLIEQEIVEDFGEGGAEDDLGQWDSEDLIKELIDRDYTREDLLEEIGTGETLRDQRWEELFDWIKENKSIEEANAAFKTNF